MPIVLCTGSRKVLISTLDGIACDGSDIMGWDPPGEQGFLAVGGVQFSVQLVCIIQNYFDLLRMYINI